MRKITNKIISCALSAFMLGEMFVQNAEPFMRLPLTVSAEEAVAAADAEPEETPADTEGETAQETEPATEPEEPAEEPEEPEEPVVEYPDLVISGGKTEKITVPTEVGNLVIEGSSSKLLLPEFESALTVHGNVEIRSGGTLDIL